MISLISIYTGAFLTLLLALLHTQFPVFFKWKIEFRKVSDLNKRIFLTIHIALFLLFFGIGIFTLIYAQQLSESKGMAFGFNLLNALFWLWRLLWQFYYFKGKLLHYVFIFGFTLLFLSYSLPIILNWKF